MVPRVVLIYMQRTSERAISHISISIVMARTLTRWTAADSGESIATWWYLDFAPGQTLKENLVLLRMTALSFERPHVEVGSPYQATQISTVCSVLLLRSSLPALVLYMCQMYDDTRQPLS